MSSKEDRLDGLETRLTQMSNEELLAFVRSVRQDRKIPQHQVKAKRKRKTKAKSELAELLKGLDPETLRAILKKGK